MSSGEQGVKPVAKCAIDQKCPSNEPSTANDSFVPSCWICLEEGPDQSGKGLVRDCSCRGNSGFAHLGCLVQYAKRTSMDLTVDQLVISNGSTECEVRKFTMHWGKCSICQQMYQGELALDLANSLLIFIDEKKSEKGFIDQIRYMNALVIKTDVLLRTLEYSNDSDLESEGKQSAHKLLAMAQQMKNKTYEAFAHARVGYFEALTKESHEYGIENYRKAIKIYKFMGDTGSAKREEVNMAYMKAKHDGTGPESSDEVLKNDQDLHEYYVQEEGERSVGAISSGLNLAVTLSELGHAIAGERLLTKQMRLSLQIHGRDHDITKQVKSCSELVKQRKVIILSQLGVEFEALRYEADRDAYVVMRASHGVIDKSGCVSPGSTKGEIFTIASKDILWRTGTPVVCQGLKKASHLNGKIGDARSYNYRTGRYGVQFEHAGKPVAVKKENLRIVFDFPC